MQFSLSASLKVIERTPKALEALLSGLSDEWINGREGPESWSAKEVVAHLILCEETNWLPRVKIMLSEDSKKILESIDMTSHFGLAEGHSLDTLLLEFKALRAKSIAELEGFGLQASDYEKSAIHPKLSKVTLRQLLTTWVAHDLSHLAQISRVLAKQYQSEVGPFREYLKILH